MDVGEFDVSDAVIGWRWRRGPVEIVVSHGVHMTDVSEAVLGSRDAAQPRSSAIDFRRRTREDRPVRTSTLLALVWLSGCRTVAAGVVERADALLADYRNRPPPTWEAAADSAPRPWAPRQFTVYSRASEGRVVLERVSIRRGRGDDVRVAIDRLGGGDQLRVHLTLARQPTRREELAALVIEAWVTRGEGPEIHTLGAAPADVLSLAADTLISPPRDGAAETLVVPAGRFEGCVGGAHPLVPISGVVRQRVGGDVRELLEFGDDNGGALF